MDQLQFLKFSAMELRGQDSGDFLFGLELIVGLKREIKGYIWILEWVA